MKMNDFRAWTHFFWYRIIHNRPTLRKIKLYFLGKFIFALPAHITQCYFGEGKKIYQLAVEQINTCVRVCLCVCAVQNSVLL